MSTTVENVFDTAGVPEYWTHVTLGTICEIVRGVSYKKDQAGEQAAEGKVPILRATNIQDGALVLDSDLVYVPADIVSEKQMLRVGDIVVATSSGSKHLVGKTAQVKDAWAGSFGAFCAALRPKVEIDHRYLGYFFGSKEYKDYITKKALGININNLRRGDLEQISVSVAPLDQQKRIVAEIEKQFSRLDEAVANLKRVQANLKRYKASVLKAAVEGKLVEIEAELARREGRSYETSAQLLQRILETRRSQWKGRGKYKEPAAPDVSDLPELPEGWVWATVSQVLVEPIVNGLSSKESSSATEVRALRLCAMSDDGFDYSDHRFLPTRLEDVSDILICEGDFFVSRGNGSLHLVGRATVAQRPPFDVIFPDTMMRVRLAKSVDSTSWLKIIWPAMFVRRQIEQRVKTTAGIYKISQPELSGITVPLPPFAEQLRIVAEVDRRLSVLRETEIQIDANLQRAERLRQSILVRAFSEEGHLEWP